MGWLRGRRWGEEVGMGDEGRGKGERGKKYHEADVGLRGLGHE